MSQTREKWDSLVLTRGDFWMIWRCRSILCFHFHFLFRNNGIREQLDQKDLRRCFGNFFFRKCHSASYVESSFSTITRHLDKGIWKTLSSWRFHRHGSTKVSSLDQDIWLIIVCFSFSQTNLDFAFNLIWWGNFRHNLFTFLSFDILCILKFTQYPYAFHENQ